MNANAPWKPVQELPARVRGDVFLREIDLGLDLGQDTMRSSRSRLMRRDSLRPAVPAPPHGQLRARMDQVRHRLGLGQVDPAVEKGAPGELARLRQAAPFSNTVCRIARAGATRRGS